MTCSDFDPDIVDLARNALSGAGAQRVMRHVQTCEACAARLARERALTDALRDVARDEPAARFEPMEEALLAAFAAQHPERRRPTRVPADARRWLAMAAALVLAAVTWAGWALRQTGGAASSAPSVVNVARTGAAPALTAMTGATPVEPATERAATRQKTSTARRPPAPVRDVIAFVPLPAAAGLPEIESGRVVRVELPMSMLPAYGIDVGPDDAARVVEADVLVGQDGQPRGIRFVNTNPDSRRRQ